MTTTKTLWIARKGGLFLWLLASLAVGRSLAQQKYTIHGMVSEAKSGETLIGATLISQGSGKGTVTDNYGRYSLTLPEGEVHLTCAYMGFATEQRTFYLSADTMINFALEDGVALREVTVVGHYNPSNNQTTQMSAVTIPAEQIKRVPAIFGENDVLKALQLLPGVQSGTEGASGFYVRGGGPDQNLIMMDGIPLYNVNHLGGFFSNFNSDAIKNVTLYKGSFPARFGGRLSSVIDVRTKDGDDQHYHGTASIGLISSRINVEGPIIKGKTTFNISARRTYLDLITRPIMWYVQKKQNMSERVSAGYNFYDLNLKVTHKVSDRDKLFLSAYMGDDVASFSLRALDDVTKDFSVRSKMNWDWGNLVAALRWNHVINGQMFLNSTVSFNRYRSNLKLSAAERSFSDGYASFSYNSGVRDLAIRSELNYKPTPNHNIQAGAEYIFHTFRPDVSAFHLSGKINDQSIRMDTTLVASNIPAHEATLFFEDDWDIASFLKANLGLHYSLFAVGGRSYHSLEPRVSARVMLGERLSFKMGYAMMSQYIHLLSANLVSLPTDLWVPSTERITPMTSHQMAAGLFYHLPDWGDFSIEGYYKKMNNLLEYKDGAGFLAESRGWEDLVAMGDGRAYGLEFLWQKQFGNTTGWVGYTWSRSLRQFNRPGQELNEGEVFPAKYDRIHDFNITVMHKFSDAFDVTASWTYCTGNTATIDFQSYNNMSEIVDAPILGKFPSEIPYISSRNNYRLPASHRLDLGLNFYRKYRKSGHTGIWNLSIYNAYCALNPFFVEKGTVEKDGKWINILRQITIFPIIPTISYTYKF